MDQRKAAQTPVTSVRVRETLRQIAPSRVALPLVADPQMILNALPLGVVIAQPEADGRWNVAASNQLFDRWSSLEEASALGLPLEMIACLEQGDFLQLFIRFAEDDGSQVADYRLSVAESPRARPFAIRLVRMAARGRLQIPLRACHTDAEPEDRKSDGQGT